MSEPDLKKTPLHAAHGRAGARMVPFGGWDMPVQYAGVVAEHRAVREAVGVFDVSHMGEFRVRGPDALAFLQRATTNDAARLKPGRAQYTLLPNAAGGLVDDLYLYMAAEGDYLIVANAANVAKDFAHLQALATGYDVQLSDESDRWALLAVQGPLAEATLQPYAGSDLSVRKKNAYFQTTLFDFPVWLARTGYTGEDGFEVFVPSEQAEVVWDKLLAIGVVPVGLGARDTLRLEAAFPLYGHEFGEDIHPLSSGYGWAVKDKDFHGRAGILDTPSPQKLIGLALERVPVREGYPVKQAGRVVGRVTSGSVSPSLGHPIALALVDAAAADAGDYTVEVRGRDVPATRTELPFYKRG